MMCMKNLSLDPEHSMIAQFSSSLSMTAWLKTGKLPETPTDSLHTVAVSLKIFHRMSGSNKLFSSWGCAAWTCGSDRSDSLFKQQKTTVHQW
jgi:hypothetical protein